jgi:hypothetical protein
MVQYEEHQPFTLWPLLMGGVGLAAVGARTSPALIPLLLAGGLLTQFRALDVRVTDEEIEFGFGRMRKRFPVEEVVGCEPYPIRLREFGGIGIRLNLRGDVCYNSRFGDGTRLTLASGRRYLLSVPAASLCAALRRAGAPLREPPGTGATEAGSGP